MRNVNKIFGLQLVLIFVFGCSQNRAHEKFKFPEAQYITSDSGMVVSAHPQSSDPWALDDYDRLLESAIFLLPGARPDSGRERSLDPARSKLGKYLRQRALWRLSKVS